MASHRALRMAEAIREVVSTAILFEVADPRIRSVTVLRVEVAGDMRRASVFVSVMGTETEQRTAMQGLQSASGFIQSRVAARLQTRFTPVLTFKRDDSVKKSIAITKLIDDALASDRHDSLPGTLPPEGQAESLDDETIPDPRIAQDVHPSSP
jgi:ribosome-binding factor A